MKFFVYGTLKSGFGNNYLLRTSKFLGTHTTKPNYTMYSLGGFPGVVNGGDTPIRGEVYEVKETSIQDMLYNLEGYRGPDNPNNFYNLHTIDTEYGKAVMFVLNRQGDERFYTKVNDGIWI